MFHCGFEGHVSPRVLRLRLLQGNGKSASRNLATARIVQTLEPAKAKLPAGLGNGADMPIPTLPMLCARCVVVTIILAVPAAMHAQQAQSAAPGAPPAAAPVPAQILSAKKAFVSNGGTDATARAKLSSGSMDINTTYNQFYAAMNDWKRYDLVSDPGQADVVLEISFTAPETDCGRGECAQPQIMLIVYDARSHFKLWTITEPVEGALLESTWKKNFATGVESAVLELKQLTAPKL
jgi:hypothetical protein